MVAKNPPSGPDPIRFDIQPLDRAVIDLLPETCPPGRWAAMHAVRHLNSGWLLKNSDPEMACFRCITAEEEAATAIFHSLKRHNYEGAEYLKPRNHVHKAALWPFLVAVSRKLAEPTKHLYERMSVRLNRNETPLRLQLVLQMSLDGKSYNATPVPPLNFRVEEFSSVLPNPRVATFQAELEKLATAAGFKTVLDQMQERANFRNRLLYAAPDGCPRVTTPVDEGLCRSQRWTLSLLKLFVMIDPYPQHQLFVQQCLTAFINMLKAVPGAEFALDRSEPSPT